MVVLFKHILCAAVAVLCSLVVKANDIESVIEDGGNAIIKPIGPMGDVPMVDGDDFTPSDEV